MTNIGTLNERLQSRLQQDRTEIEAQAKAELLSLSDSLNGLLKNALLTTESAMNDKTSDLITAYSEMADSLHSETLRLQKTLLRAWVRNLLIGSGIIAGLAAGTWGLSATLGNRVASLQTSITNMEKHARLLQNTVSELEDKTGGIVLMTTKDGRFLILPQGMNLKSGWQIGTLPAWKLE